MGTTESISPKELIAKLILLYGFILSKFLLILAIATLGAILGFTYAFFKKPIYSAETTFVLDDPQSSKSLGAYSGLASIAGLDLGAKGGLFQEDNIIELYKSRTMMFKTLLSSAYFKDRKQLLIERYLEFNKIKLNCRNGNDECQNFAVRKDEFGTFQDSVLMVISNRLKTSGLKVEKLDKNLNIIKVQFTSNDELFAKAFIESLVKNVNDFYVETKTNKGILNVRILQHQADSVRRILNMAISNVAKYSGSNPNANAALQILKIPAERTTIDVQANSAILLELVKNLELARISLRSETPLIKIVDGPILPLKREKVSEVWGAFGGFFIFLFLATFYLILKKLLQID